MFLLVAIGITPKNNLIIFLGLKNVRLPNRKIIGYCRVSSHKQKDDLERQIESVKAYMLAKGY